MGARSTEKAITNLCDLRHGPEVCKCFSLVQRDGPLTRAEVTGPELLFADKTGFQSVCGRVGLAQ
jgi:hypothetical protein